MPQGIESGNSGWVLRCSVSHYCFLVRPHKSNGWLTLDRVIEVSARRKHTDLGCVSWAIRAASRRSRSSTVELFTEFALKWRMWITCRWLNPLQLTTWESASTVRKDLRIQEPVDGSSLWRPPALSETTGGSASEMCDIEEHGVLMVVR